MADAPVRAVLYARISEDDLGLERGVKRQLDDARSLAKTRGWRVVAEYSDNDVSALNGAFRTGYTALMGSARTGDVDRIVVYQTSRLWRNRSERSEAIDALGKARVGIEAVRGPSFDLSSGYGRGMAGMLGEFDTMESEVKGERVARAAQTRAAEGHANGAVLYGWTRRHEHNDRGRVIAFHDDEDPVQAAIVREITDRLIEGDTLAAIRADLNARGIPAPGAAWQFKSKVRAIDNVDGTQWGRTSVKKLAMRPANAGLRVHHRGRPDEMVVDAAWPPIVPRERWERVVAILAAPTRVVERPASRQHLLTWGIGRCGVCGGHLRVASRGSQTYGSKARLYVCDARGCVGRNEASVDAFVAAVVIERLSQPDALDWLAGDDRLAQRATERADALRARLDVAADQYADAKITASMMERITAGLAPQIQAADEERRRHASTVPLDSIADLAGPKAAQRWEAMPLTRRRALLQALGLAVVIDRVTRRGPGFDPRSVRVEWSRREEPSTREPRARGANVGAKSGSAG